MSDIVIEMTPFVYEDGKTYYFEIHKRESNTFHNLYVYKKVLSKKKNFFVEKEEVSYELINERPELIRVELDVNEIKSNIKKILIANSAAHQIKNWDGFVGDIPDDVKKALLRNSKLDD